LLLGESGTGKELFARAIHNWSERKDRPFVAINCVGLSKDLLESDLFGHERGAFTGAHQLKKGKVELAHGGTIFLDEIGDVSAELQTKLLRFLQEREFERVGGTQAIRVDVRIIAATNRDLQSAMKEGRFREDLYYRLNVVPITLPPLRDRREDIPDLAQFFVGRFSKEAKKSITGISPAAMERLISYDWPGNVRELGNVIERAIVLGTGGQIDLQDVGVGITMTELTTSPEHVSYHQAIDGFRREVIVQALAETQGNRAAAARLLGLERSYLLRLMKSFQIT
jgi:transcriptional regulator with PAS, ATPase and Fis domain